MTGYSKTIIPNVVKIKSAKQRRGFLQVYALWSDFGRGNTVKIWGLSNRNHYTPTDVMFKKAIRVPLYLPAHLLALKIVSAVHRSVLLWTICSANYVPINSEETSRTSSDTLNKTSHWLRWETKPKTIKI